MCVAGPQEVDDILSLASVNNLLVIPLIQTFGHLEHVLKLSEFQHLREEGRYPQALCPSFQDSLALVKEMIDQVFSLISQFPSFLSFPSFLNFPHFSISLIF